MIDFPGGFETRPYRLFARWKEKSLCLCVWYVGFVKRTDPQMTQMTQMKS